MKGVVITLDSLFALSVFVFVMILIAGQAYTARAPGTIYLKQLTLDTITVLEKTGRVDAALGNDTDAMQDVLEATPDAACIRVSLINASDNVVAAAARADCTDNLGLDLQVASMPVMHRGSEYILRAESWFRKEPG
jgi:hypothetical protein